MQNRSYRLLSAVIGVVAICLPASVNGQTILSEAERMPVRRQATVEIDSVECRDDLTRVYCRIIGTPHTADRVDAVTLLTEKSTYEAVDIDGVDFKRYFQWEDEGYVPLEIDFPVLMQKNGCISLVFKTVYGDIKASK